MPKQPNPYTDPAPSVGKQFLVMTAYAVVFSIPVAAAMWFIPNIVEDRKARIAQRNYRLIKGI